MPYDDLNNTHNPATGTNPPAAWGDQVRTNFECGEVTIARTILGGAASSISSGTLPTLSNAWALKFFVRCQNSGGTAQSVLLRFNGDTGSNYTRQYTLGLDTTTSSDAEATTTSLNVGTCGNESANRWANVEGVVLDYLGSGHKTVISRCFDPRNLTAPLLIHVGGLWASTSAITSVSVVSGANNFVTGSSLTVMACNYV